MFGESFILSDTSLDENMNLHMAFHDHDTTYFLYAIELDVVTTESYSHEMIQSPFSYAFQYADCLGLDSTDHPQISSRAGNYATTLK